MPGCLLKDPVSLISWEGCCRKPEQAPGSVPQALSLWTVGHGLGRYFRAWRRAGDGLYLQRLCELAIPSGQGSGIRGTVQESTIEQVCLERGTEDALGSQELQPSRYREERRLQVCQVWWEVGPGRSNFWWFWVPYQSHLCVIVCYWSGGCSFRTPQCWVWSGGAREQRRVEEVSPEASLFQEGPSAGSG